MAGEITFEQFRRETHAILIETRMSDPEKIADVENAQHKTLERKGLLELFTPLQSFVDAEGNVVEYGVDRTLINVMDGITDLAELNAHVEKIKQLPQAA